MLEAGLPVSTHLQTDDTGARHKGRNGYCTYIGNERFAWFESTESKNRVNFLGLLRAGHEDYVLNAAALEYMGRHKQSSSCGKKAKAWLVNRTGKPACGKSVSPAPSTSRSPPKGSLLAHGFPSTMGIVSDEAGPFNGFRLPWAGFTSRAISPSGSH